jgi:NADH:ubiquinone oxidoreductase subunit 5 (subunit L)/multisubunit Na+/H+ antiporter MnhA subunit
MCSILLIFPILILILILFNKFIGIRGMYIFIAFSFTLIFNLLIIYNYEISYLQSTLYNFMYNWIQLYSISIPISITLNFININMLTLIILISSIVHYYSIEYMRFDLNIIKFFIFLLLFTESMLLLVCADNLLCLFIGWEGVGICSFLLISFWNTRIETARSAFLAVFLNKIGDLTLLFAILYLLFYIKVISFESLSFLLIIIEYNQFYLLYENNVEILIFIYIVIAIIAKSGQLGLHMWLPEAMEGPTPVSALLHAATMVTAGVYLLIKLNFLIILNSSVILIFLLITSFGILFFTIGGLMQEDAKKSIAYSTCAQLSFMIFSCFHNLYQIAFFHLIIHAFFKAGLFLTTGYLSHTDEEDELEDIFIVNNTITISILITLFSLTSIGLFDIGAALSKEKILEYSMNFFIPFEYYIFYLGFGVISLIFFFNGLYYSIHYITYISYLNLLKYIKTNNYLFIIQYSKKYVQHNINILTNNIMLNSIILLSLIGLCVAQLLFDIFIGEFILNWNINNDLLYNFQDNLTLLTENNNNELFSIPVLTISLWLCSYYIFQINDPNDILQQTNFMLKTNYISFLFLYNISNKFLFSSFFITNFIYYLNFFFIISLIIEKKFMELPYKIIITYNNFIVDALISFKKGFFFYYITIFIYLLFMCILYLIIII